MRRIAIFASGNGTNAENLIKHFFYNESVMVAAVFCNNPDAKVLEKARTYAIPAIVFNREDLYETNRVLRDLRELEINFIALAGFMWLVPDYLVREYRDKIINVHPALLPKYGGKGMYGKKVHEAVIKNKEKESGITIHYVNEKYDEGTIIYQHKCEVAADDTPESLAEKVHRLEYEHYPEVIEELLSGV